MNLISPQGQTGRPQYSLHSLLRALADPSSKDGGYEFETSQELARQLGRKPNGVFVPVNALTRDLTVGSPTGGGNTVATNLRADSFVEMLRNRSLVVGAGATVLNGLVGNVAIPRQTSHTTAYWIAEGVSPTESAPTFDQVPMTPKTLSAFCDVSRKMVLQSSLDISDFVKSDLTAAIGLEIDRAAINGSGTANQPTGILNTNLVENVSFGGAVPTWAKILELAFKVLTSPGTSTGASMAFAMTTRMAAKLMATLKAAGLEGYILEGSGENMNIAGHRVIASNQMPFTSDAGHSILYADFSKLTIGHWGVLDLLLDPYTLSTSGGLRIVAAQDVDIVVRNYESFAYTKNASI